MGKEDATSHKPLVPAQHPLSPQKQHSTTPAVIQAGKGKTVLSCRPDCQHESRQRWAYLTQQLHIHQDYLQERQAFQAQLKAPKQSSRLTEKLLACTVKVHSLDPKLPFQIGLCFIFLDSIPALLLFFIFSSTE